MATPIILGDVVECRVFGQDSTAGEWINVYHLFVITVPTGPITDQDVCNAVDAAIAPLYKPIIPNNSSYDGVECRIVNRAGPPPAFVSQNSNNGVGSGGATSAPTQDCGLISWSTDLAGPAYRGRSYIGPLPTAALATNGRMISGWVTLIKALANWFFTAAAITAGGHSVGVNFGVYRRVTRGGNAFASYNVTVRVATQRRRGSFGKNKVPPI